MLRMVPLPRFAGEDPEIPCHVNSKVGNVSAHPGAYNPSRAFNSASVMLPGLAPLSISSVLTATSAAL